MRIPTRAWVAACCAATVVSLAPLRATPSSPSLTREDLRWLNRVTFGVDETTAARYQQLGRARFLDEQLHPSSDDPADLAAAIRAIPVSSIAPEDALRTARTEQSAIRQMRDAAEQQRARMALNQQRGAAVAGAAERQLMRDLYSPAQLREVMTWFWMNHFNVFSGKGAVGLLVADYENRAVRPRALGHFRDLVLATLTSPAMLVYLDNAQSSAGEINENYARELMELHTLGVSGGPSGSHYTQRDVQELARVLTGVGLSSAAIAGRGRRAPAVSDGAFAFLPNRHDAGTKTVLGQTIRGSGFDEVKRAVTLLCHQPATARFISAKLATYFAADDPPAGLVDAMSATFERTDGDIAAVLETMFTSSAFTRLLDRPAVDAGKFKDPQQFIVSSLRLAYEGKRISNYRPIMNWLQQLDEAPYGRVTPDGYPLVESAWASSGQMVKRFEIARLIGTGNARLFDDDKGVPRRAGVPMLTSRLFYDVIQPTLGASTRAALDRTASQQEWNTVLLSSPEWMER
jgi:uncharacterized protein (DUF1800 family)